MSGSAISPLEQPSHYKNALGPKLTEAISKIPATVLYSKEFVDAL